MHTLINDTYIQMLTYFALIIVIYW